MANKQINELDAAPSIDPASDLVIIQKANGGTYKITIDELVNASSKVSSSTQLGAPEAIQISFTHKNNRTINITNMFSTNGSGVLSLAYDVEMIAGGSLMSGVDQDASGVLSIVKTAGVNSLLIGGQILSIGGPAKSFKLGKIVGYRYSAKGGSSQKYTTGYISISATKDSLTLAPQASNTMHFWAIGKYVLSGSVSAG
jgi:hypothetical protein